MKQQRNFYACQDFFKLGNVDNMPMFGKTVFVFKSDKERDAFLMDNKDPKEFFKLTQKEAYKIMGLNTAKSIACVYPHSYFKNLFVLSNIRQCWGNAYKLLSEF